MRKLIRTQVNNIVIITYTTCSRGWNVAESGYPAQHPSLCTGNLHKPCQSHLASCQLAQLTLSLTLHLLFMFTAVFTLEPKRCIGLSVAFHVNFNQRNSERRFPWTGTKVRDGKSNNWVTGATEKKWKRNQLRVDFGQKYCYQTNIYW